MGIPSSTTAIWGTKALMDRLAGSLEGSNRRNVTNALI